MSTGRKPHDRATYGCGGDPIDDDLADDWCTLYHCAGDCGLRGHGWQHQFKEATPKQIAKADEIESRINAKKTP